MSAAWDRRAQRAAIPPLKPTVPAVPTFPGMAPTPGGTAGVHHEPARADHTHPEQDVVPVLTSNRMTVEGLHISQPLSTGDNIVQFDVVKDDPLSAWDPTNFWWTAPADGVYEFFANVNVGSTSQTVALFLSLFANSDPFTRFDQWATQKQNNVASGAVQLATSYRSFKGRIVAGNQVAIYVNTSSGASPRITGGFGLNSFSVIFLGN